MLARKARRKQPRASVVHASVLEQVTWREQHKALSDDSRPTVVRVEQQVVDARGKVGAGMRVYDTLAALLRNGAITKRQEAAGRQFEEIFIAAGLNQLQAASMERVPGGAGVETDSMLANRRRLHRALAVLGGIASAVSSTESPAARCAWAVLGEGKTLREYASETIFGTGPSLNESTAKGILVAALSVLAGHFER